MNGQDPRPVTLPRRTADLAADLTAALLAGTGTRFALLPVITAPAEVPDPEVATRLRDAVLRAYQTHSRRGWLRRSRRRVDDTAAAGNTLW